MPTLLDLRQRLSQRFGGFQRITAGVQTTAGGEYTGKATGTDATRRIVSTDLADLDLAGTASDSSGTVFDGVWGYIPDTLEQRRVVQNGYVPNVAASTVCDASATTARVGYIVFHRALAAVLPGGTLAAIHRWPVKDDDRKLGLHTAINQALQQLMFKDRLSLTGLGTSVNRYSLAAYPWIIDEDQLVETEWKEYISGLDPQPLAGGATLRLDADTPYLITGSGVATTDTFTFDIMRPRSSWIKVGGTWGESTVGLQNDSDECTGAAVQIVSLAEYYICRDMEQHDPVGAKGLWAQRAARIATAIGPSIRRELTRMGRSYGSAGYPLLANVPGGLREVAGGGGGSWP